MTRGRTPRLALLAVTTIAAIAGIAVASALAVAPPPGTPDLSQMGVQASDLAAGSQTKTAGYVTPPTGIVAEYRSTYGVTNTEAGTPLAGVDSEVELAASTTTAVTAFGHARRAFASKPARRLLTRLFVAAGRKAHLKARDVHFGRLGAAGVGQRSFLQPIIVRERGRRIVYEFLGLNVDTIDALVSVYGVGAKRTSAGAKQLGGDVAAHISSLLATGTTGTTGATGATG
jgi:hypothetical protein